MPAFAGLMQARTGAGDDAIDLDKVAPQFGNFAAMPCGLLRAQKLGKAGINPFSFAQSDVNGPGFQRRGEHQARGALPAPLSMREPKFHLAGEQMLKVPGWCR